jgi:hypothetical protein
MCSVNRNAGYPGSNERDLRFGLGAAHRARVRVIWLRAPTSACRLPGRRTRWRDRGSSDCGDSGVVEPHPPPLPR